MNHFLLFRTISYHCGTTLIAFLLLVLFSSLSISFFHHRQCAEERVTSLSLSPVTIHSLQLFLHSIFFSRKNEQCSHLCIQCTFDALFFVFICSASSYQWPTRPVSPFDKSAANTLPGEVRVREGNYLNKQRERERDDNQNSSLPR